MTLDPLTTTITVFISLLVSALLSAAETAFTSASKARMHTLAQEGNKAAQRVNRIWQEKDLLIGAILVGYNVINVVSSGLMTAMMIDMFGEAGLAYATAIMSVLIVLFVEILPKTIAIRAPDATALFLAPFVELVMFVLVPITVVCRTIILFVLKPFRFFVSRSKREEEAEQELRGVIDMHADVFDAGEDTASMLHAVVDLADMTVADVMTHRRDMVAVNMNQSTAKIIQDILDAKHSRVPLYGKSPEDIISVIDARLMLAALAGRMGRIDDIDLKPISALPWFIPDNTKLLDQLQAFRARNQKIAFVVDEYGVLLGMLTLADILEEIVGHYDKGQFNALAVPKAQADGSMILDGRFPLRELNRELGWDLDDDEATTIAGYVINHAQRIPEPGDTVVVGGLQFDILARKQRQIARVRVRIVKDAVS